ncbi:prolipoprotein diacylglyceryl transferase [Patescibacteria group bacterium]|nr:prolipoprotein diacylglyceryl transferase [Patescibacteria group bacterium]
MYPVIIQIGPLIVYSLWLFAGLALLAGVFVFTSFAKIKKLQMNFVYNHSLEIFIAGLVMARLFFVIKNYQIYFYQFSVSSFKSIFFIWDKGLSFLGAVIGITLAIVFFAKREDEPLRKWLDILTISVLAGLFISHIGAFLDGVGHGTPTSLPWGITIESPTIKYAVPIHPTQIYTALYSIIIAGILTYTFLRKKLESGLITAYGILTYAFFTFVTGFMRGDDVLTLIWLREEQIVSIIAMFIAGGYIYSRYNNNISRKISDNNIL